MTDHDTIDGPAALADPQRISDRLAHARRRTLALCALEDEDLLAQHSPLMSPLVWDLAHIANYEELWLVRALGGSPVRPDLDSIYDAFENARADRPGLPLLGPDDARRYLAEVRAMTEARLDSPPAEGVDPRLVANHRVHRMVIQHEHMHDETMLATRQLMGAGSPPLPDVHATPSVAPSDQPAVDGEVVIPGGTYRIGVDLDDEPWAFDNEGGSHEVSLESFAIDRTPVTNHAYREFVEAGGYEDPSWWTGAGWQWRLEADLVAPQFWTVDDGSWSVERFGRVVELDPCEPVQHVCWYEADAYARWAGRRLPSEFEWEVAASVTPDGRKRRFPWGDEAIRSGDHRPPANLGQTEDGPRPVGGNPDGVSAWGCHDLIGDVWEWTSSTFEPYPGFEAFPYREYSEVFWGDEHRVLRGGSWAVDPVAVRTTFRNWDLPIRRQIFAGFRCARDVHTRSTSDREGPQTGGAA